MQVILTQDIEKIGRRGEIVDVSRGYVRNFLTPVALQRWRPPRRWKRPAVAWKRPKNANSAWPSSPTR